MQGGLHLLGAGRQLDAGDSSIGVVRHNDGVIAGGTSQSSTISSLLHELQHQAPSASVAAKSTHCKLATMKGGGERTYLLNVADDGSLGHLADGLDVADCQRGLLPAVDKLHAAHMWCQWLSPPPSSTESPVQPCS